MYQYQIKKGAENRTFSEEGVRRSEKDNTIIISDHQLSSPYLTLINDEQKQQTQMTATADNPPVPPNPPVTPPEPSIPPQNTQTTQGGTNS